MVEHSLRRQRFLVRATLIGFAGLGVAAGLFVLATVPPTASSWYPKCLSNQLFGIHCPGCGTTRALHSLLNAEFGQAIAYNPLALALLPAVLVPIARWTWCYLRGRRYRTLVLPTWMLPALVVLIFAYGVVRNIPHHPFTLLAPHEVDRPQ